MKVTQKEFCIETEAASPRALASLGGILWLGWALRESVTAHNMISLVLTRLSNHLSKYKLSIYIFFKLHCLGYVKLCGYNGVIIFIVFTCTETPLSVVLSTLHTI